MNSNIYSDIREKIVEYLKQELLGPRGGDDETLTEEPFQRYTTGVLFPLEESFAHSAPDLLNEQEEEPQGNTGSSEEDQGDDPISLANQTLPSSLGMSFFIRHNPVIRLRIVGAKYKEDDVDANGTDAQGWQRNPLPAEDFIVRHEVIGRNRVVTKTLSIFEDMADVNVIWRKTGSDGWIITVTVINKRRREGAVNPEDCLHQVEIHCYPIDSGAIGAYPRSRLLTDDKEEGVLDVLYRDQVAYGVGHGCAVAWSEPVSRTTDHIWTEYIPTYSIPPMQYNIEASLLSNLLGAEVACSFDRVLDFHFLAHGEDNRSEIIRRLNEFVLVYSKWIHEVLEEKNRDIPEDFSTEKAELISRLRLAANRMSRGVRLLEHDEIVFRAFCLANRAMLLQRIHISDEYAGKKHRAESLVYKFPDLNEYRTKHVWRPFQLAFQLLTISSVAFEEDPDRQIVDLIWFPTGGGKTEAYLAVSAFLIFYRRMIHGIKGFGTSVLMRYTLRLLTTQQFQRASTLLCACEILRRENPDELGSEPISIGLWVGGSTTPNSFQEASNQFEDLIREDRPLSPYQVDRCPWCGSELVPEVRRDDISLYGIRATPTEFELFCPNKTCPFHASLPVKVVDAQLYRSPATLLLATVDKFARMPWEERVVEFFGAGMRRPPELIIQDELHLISGPLGTMVGMYETAIDALIELNGVKPKVIASTATIRRADEQSLGLYARSARLFPPSGLRASDSFFARYDNLQPGRMYLGVLGQGHTGSTTMIRVCAALLQAPIDLELSGDELDAYYTLVAYHNSLRELGKTLTFASDDIPARIQVIGRDQSSLRDLSGEKVAELTSNIDSRELGNVLNRLNLRAYEEGSIGFLACTNMLSVGVDVPRLGLMLVNGQPKSTSEYIQSTSRVGRSSVPGLVVCMYSPSKPRDRSHYERFVAYHSAIYREVEPTSVTPFSAPARQRALHAVLVSLVRHSIGLNGNRDARKFSVAGLQAELEAIVDFISTRVSLVDRKELSATEQEVDALLKEWEAFTDKNLHYDIKHRAKKSLLMQWGSAVDGVWNTLNSMRNVDQSTLVKSRDQKRLKNE